MAEERTMNDRNMDVKPSGVSAQEIIASIEMILGRTPDQALVDYHLRLGFPDRFALGEYMLSTGEFEQRYISGAATGNEPSSFWEARAHGANIRRKRLKAFGPHARGILVSTSNGLFVVDPEDGFIANSLLHHGTYSSDELAFDLSLLNPSSQVLVVGTHIGSLAIPLARHCAHLTALEANPQTFELLEANVRLSGASNITLHHVVVGETDGKVIQFVMNRDNSGGSKIMPKLKREGSDGYLYDNPEIVELRTARVDTLLGNRTFDLIIMDIEGSEVFALRGMPQILQSARALAVEFRPHSLVEVAGVTIDDFLASVKPYFSWLYVPGGDLVTGNDVEAKLRMLFSENICHDAIYFFKDAPAKLV